MSPPDNGEQGQRGRGVRDNGDGVSCPFWPMAEGSAMDVMRHCGVVVVPKSTHVERVCENLDIWNFGLQAG